MTMVVGPGWLMDEELGDQAGRFVRRAESGANRARSAWTASAAVSGPTSCASSKPSPARVLGRPDVAADAAERPSSSCPSGAGHHASEACSKPDRRRPPLRCRQPTSPASSAWLSLPDHMIRYGGPAKFHGEAKRAATGKRENAH